MFLTMLLINLIFSIFLVLVFYLGNFILSIKEGNMMKISSFESGFSSLGKIQSSFSIHFFIMMLMFVIFDLEVVMFLGIIISDLSSFLSFLMLFMFVLGGFYMEWWYGKLVWVV